ncbi:hypothetical protein [Actinocatenispora comari]|uniref:Uncharacterized protein n=1 Tax=Actinocatenispora comari TaxID=2807577 RepID=A0A8J4EIY3_9ACTN|nr:hypothetical protein [Actinocatenispora comari]GIL25450.1 hypothetical protein NUM_07050 [Actinocatenispora comari]
MVAALVAGLLTLPGGAPIAPVIALLAVGCALVAPRWRQAGGLGVVLLVAAATVRALTGSPALPIWAALAVLLTCYVLALDRPPSWLPGSRVPVVAALAAAVLAELGAAVLGALTAGRAWPLIAGVLCAGLAVALAAPSGSGRDGPGGERRP